DERRHDRTRDDDLAGTQMLAESRKHIGNMSHDVDPLACGCLRIGCSRSLDAPAYDAADEAVARTSCSLRLHPVQGGVTVIDVAGQDCLRVLWRRVDIDKFNDWRDAGNRSRSSVAVGARQDVLANVYGDFGFGDRFSPARKRYLSA